MENSSWNYISCEIVEQILLDVPTADLVYNKSWVCKTWTNIILQPSFWIRKLRKIGIIINEEIRSVLTGFEINIQVACLYHTCLNEEKAISKSEYYKFNLPISDDFSEMLKVAGCLLTRSAMRFILVLKKEVIPVLPILMKLLAMRKSEVTVWDYYSFWNFSPRNLQMLKGPNGVANIRELVGCVSTLEGLNQHASDITISIAVDKDNKAIDPGFCKTGREMRAIYIKAGADISRITRLRSSRISIIVSGLEPTHIIWMNDLLKNLTHGRSFDKLVLPSYKLNKKESEELLKNMAKSRVRPLTIMCAPSILTVDDTCQLHELAAELDLGPRCKAKGICFVFYESDQELTDLEIFICMV